MVEGPRQARVRDIFSPTIPLLRSTMRFTFSAIKLGIEDTLQYILCTRKCLKFFRLILSSSTSLALLVELLTLILVDMSSTPVRETGPDVVSRVAACSVVGGWDPIQGDFGCPGTFRTFEEKQAGGVVQCGSRVLRTHASGDLISVARN